MNEDIPEQFKEDLDIAISLLNNVINLCMVPDASEADSSPIAQYIIDRIAEKASGNTDSYYAKALGTHKFGQDLLMNEWHNARTNG